LIPIHSNIDNNTLIFLNFLSKFKKIKVRILDNIQTNFFNPATFNDINNSDACFLIGTNIKIENPILHIRLRNQFLKGNFLIYNIGSPFINNIPTNFISLSLMSFVNLIEGKTKFQQIISQYNKPFFFFGKNFLNRFNLNLFNYNLKKINKNAS